MHWISRKQSISDPQTNFIEESIEVNQKKERVVNEPE